MGLIEKMFGTHSDREIKEIKKTTQKILNLEPEMQKLSNEELKSKTQEFRKRLADKETMEDILIEAFAVCREASSRVIGLKHYEVQLIGGIVLHQGRISEMKTGEGKTLVATLPAYLNGLTGNGVHVVTVNDYLANRDLETMKPLYDFLGVSSGVITHESSDIERREAYNSDITYITNTELGFDYLRDNMVKTKDDKVQKPLNFAIVDEVDSILIDESRTPLIISGASDEPTYLYRITDVFTKVLTDEDYEIDEKLNTIILSDTGIDKVEKIFELNNYADIENNTLRHYIDQAIRANFVMKKDKDYIIKNGEVLIVDEFTGRAMEGRRYGDGLHQAIEAKEGVKINSENTTLATITYQNLFRLYKKLSGMTGTAQTEENEFREIYNLDVVVIPTNMPITRIDNKDKLYISKEAKYRAIINDVVSCYEKGQPVLVGTSSIEKSEILSNLLKEKGIPHQVLNAKYLELEAQIISKAGERGTITIATNMAGRGTDIKLGEGVTELGGLKIIGSERHEARRIDNQLRGRSGRQGDAGESVFYVSFDDDLMRIFAPDKVKDMISNLSEDENIVIENKYFTNAIEKAQKRIEGMHFNARKETIKYDDVINAQRKIIYSQRDMVLNEENLEKQIECMISDVLSNIIDVEFAEYIYSGSEDLFDKTLEHVKFVLEEEFFPSKSIDIKTFKDLPVEQIREQIIEIGQNIYKSKLDEFSEEELRQTERQILLSVVDQRWINHLTDLTDLKQAVQYATFKQVEPIKEYIIQGSNLFETLINNIKEDVVRYVLKLSVPKIEDDSNNIIEE